MNKYFNDARQLLQEYNSHGHNLEKIVKGFLEIYAKIEDRQGIAADVLKEKIRSFIKGRVTGDAYYLYNHGLLDACYAVSGNPLDLGVHLSYCVANNEKFKTSLLMMGALVGTDSENILMIRGLSANQANLLFSNMKLNEWAYYQCRPQLALSILNELVVRIIQTNKPADSAMFLVDELEYLETLARSLTSSVWKDASGIDLLDERLHERSFLSRLFGENVFNGKFYAYLKRRDPAIYEEIFSASYHKLLDSFSEGNLDLRSLPSTPSMDELFLVAATCRKLRNYTMTERDMEGIEYHYGKLAKGSILDKSTVVKTLREARKAYHSEITPLNDGPIESNFNYRAVEPFFEQRFIRDRAKWVFDNPAGMANYCLTVLIQLNDEEIEGKARQLLDKVITTPEFVLGFIKQVHFNTIFWAEDDEAFHSVMKEIIMNPDSACHLAEISFEEHKQLLSFVGKMRFESSEVKDAINAHLKKIKWRNARIKKDILSNDLSL